MMLKRLFIGISFLALGGFGVLQAQPNNTQSNSRPSGQDKGFVERAYQTNLAEIQMGQLAAQRGTTNAIRQYGNDVANSRTNANNELRQIANSSGIQVPSQMGKMQQESLNRLRNANGKNFDREFLQDQMRSHRRTIGMFQKETSTGTDPQIKGWASSQIAGLQHQEQMAGNLFSQVSGAPATQGRSSYGAGQQNNPNQNRALPRTASNLPLFGLLGLLLIGAAFAARSFRLLRGTR